jgi:hypothetical protein
MVSQEFYRAVEDAIIVCRNWDDDAIAYAAYHVPVYVADRPTRAQARAGGCPACTYLGLWCDKWPGYPASPHGIIFLFEDGIASTAGMERTTLTVKTTEVLHHELEHALQRDHVLDALERRRAMYAAAGLVYDPRCHECPQLPTI